MFLCCVCGILGVYLRACCVAYCECVISFQCFFLFLVLFLFFRADHFRSNVPGKDVIVQVWKDAATLNEAVQAGYQSLASFAWYLDKQIPDPPSTHYEWVDTWQDFYMADPYNGVTGDTSLILGGETCMWAEQVDATNFFSRVWPRACGVTERLWSAQSVNSVATAIPRLVAFRCRLAQRDIGAGPIAPDYCPLPSANVFNKMRV